MKRLFAFGVRTPAWFDDIRADIFINLDHEGPDQPGETEIVVGVQSCPFSPADEKYKTEAKIHPFQSALE